MISRTLKPSKGSPGGRICNNPTGYFVYLSFVSLFDASHMYYYCLMTCGDVWVDFGKILE